MIIPSREGIIDGRSYAADIRGFNEGDGAAYTLIASFYKKLARASFRKMRRYTVYYIM